LNPDTGSSGIGLGSGFQPPILKTFVLHFGQVPFVAGLPFFSLTFFGSFISTDFLHLTQYAFVKYPTAPVSPRVNI
jgi:hypothetical protein